VQVRLDAEATAVAAARREMEARRGEAADLLANIRTTRENTSQLIEEGLAEQRGRSSAYLAEVKSQWKREQELLNRRIISGQAELSSIRDAATEAQQSALRLKIRTAVARLGRGAAAWQHDVRVQSLQQKARSARAVGLRKLTREGEEIEKKVTSCRESLNHEVRHEELLDERVRKDHRDEIKGLRDELQDVEQHIEYMQERTRQKGVLRDAVNMVQLSEGDRIQRQAEASGRDAAPRVHMGALMPGFAGEESDAISRLDWRQEAARITGKKHRGTVSAPCLPGLQGGLRQLEGQIQGRRRLPDPSPPPLV